MVQALVEITHGVFVSMVVFGIIGVPVFIGSCVYAYNHRKRDLTENKYSPRHLKS